MKSKLAAVEKDILKLAIKGYSTKQIAVILFKSPGTITNQRTTIMRKLKARNFTHAVSLYMKLI